MVHDNYYCSDYHDHCVGLQQLMISNDHGIRYAARSATSPITAPARKVIDLLGLVPGIWPSRKHAACVNLLRLPSKGVPLEPTKIYRVEKGTRQFSSAAVMDNANSACVFHRLTYHIFSLDSFHHLQPCVEVICRSTS